MTMIKVENAGGSHAVLYSVAIALISQAQYEMARTTEGKKQIILNKILAEVPYAQKEEFEKNIQLFDIRKHNAGFLKNFNLVLQNIMAKKKQESNSPTASLFYVPPFSPDIVDKEQIVSPRSSKGAQSPLAVNENENNINTLANYFQICVKLNGKEVELSKVEVEAKTPEGEAETENKVVLIKTVKVPKVKMEVHINHLDNKQWHTLIEIFPDAPNLKLSMEISKLTKYARGISLSLTEISEVFLGYIKDGIDIMGKQTRNHLPIAEAILQEIRKDRDMDSIMGFIAAERAKLKNANLKGSFLQAVDYLFYRYNGGNYESYITRDNFKYCNALIDSVARPLM